MDIGCLKCVSRYLAGVCVASILVSGASLAGVDDSQFVVSSDGSSVQFELREVSRREVLDRLFAGQDIKLDWVNTAVADEHISGSYGGSLSQVTRQLLGALNFILVYDGVAQESRLTRVVIVGRGSGVASPSLAVLEAAMQRAGRPVAPVPSSKPQASSAAAENARPRASEPPRVAARNPLNQPPGNGPAPTPRAIGGPAPIPVPMPANAPEPLPRMSGTLPSVAPVAGANLPVLPGPSGVPPK